MKASPYIARYTVRQRRVEDTDEFHDTESEEMFGRRVDAMDKAEAQLVESTPRVATIGEYVAACYTDSTHSEEEEEEDISWRRMRKKKRRQ